MATESVNEGVSETGPAANAVEKKDTNNTTAADAGKSTALNGDASKDVSAPQAEIAESSGAKKPADSPKSTGDKRQRDDAAPAEETTEASKEEPDEKKQKTDAEPSKAANGTETKAAANGEKKRGPGRPKKTEGGTKEKKAPKPRATEGIGSRTRSRAKAS
ncbi:hypothetical protein AJ79_00681 [Helicocarpus griseus UAMH5409]|uniref:Uncharacterized protein n=1 Tax=Helicocarpus griseus UAMH5409 TaxID=1447875 RepID=A0A2B7Y1U9_9EURO|nr:hypothetical protein AJ79_00681 [Helicocarpus griseus UAMH5409]